MAIGEGKYDDMCTYVREHTDAFAVVVVVINGNKGTGMSCQAFADIRDTLPEMLEEVAKEIRSSGKMMSYDVKNN